jgi:type VI secretion system secreted protein VgrG
MSVGFTQQALSLRVSTPLGQDKLRLKNLQGEERLSGLFHFALDMVSEDPALDFNRIVGQSATVTLMLADGTQRYFNGIVGRFAQESGDVRFTTYQADLYPWLWLLTMTTDSRIFQHQTVPDIIETIFTDLGFSDYRLALTATYSPREYCVQYQESAFAFISRLMEDEGIFYFFEHAADKHTLVLADSPEAHPACPGLSTARWRKSASSTEMADAVTRCVLEQRVTTGKYAADDFNFETPATDLLVSANGTNSTLRVYEYPGGFAKKDAGESKANVRLQAYEWPATLLRGESHCRTFVSGHRFTLSEHERADVNGSYVLRWVSHTATPEHYRNAFEAFPLGTPFRPLSVTPKPRLSGSQTAIVVGKRGEEIWTDQYGRVKVQFHWDQRGSSDENSSCWIRVAETWAGKKWGTLFIPRIGQEAVVTFLDGDPDRPLIVGTVYNSQQTAPYTLPSEQTKSTLKSNSSKGGEGFNEIRFEDKKDAEEIFIHAQRDLTLQVLNNQTATIKQDRTATVQEGHDTLVVDKGNRTVQVNAGNETHAVKGTRGLTVTGNETHTNQADFTQEVAGNFTLKVSGNITIEAQGSVAIKAGLDLTNKAGTSLNNEAGTSLTNKAGTDLTNQATTSLTNKASVSMTNDAGVSLTNKASATQTVDGGGMLVLKGGLVQIN